jgi:heavy metal sensor kinase
VRLRARLSSIRVRVTLWYLAVLLAVEVVFGVVVYIGLANRLRAEMDHALELVTTQVADVSSRGRADLDADALPPGYIASLHSPTGEQLDSAPLRAVLPWDADAARAARQGRPYWRSIAIQGQQWRVLTQPVLGQGSVSAVFQVARSEESIDAALAQLRLLLMAMVPMGLALAGGVGLFLAGRALGPIDRITRTAAAIDAEDLTRRLPGEVARTPDEVGRLASTFNHMLERLEGAFARQRQFTADASHELRTPLTLLLTQLDITMARPRATDEYQRALAGMREDVVRLQKLVHALLTLARADAGQERLERTWLDIGELVEQVVEALQGMALEHAVSLVASPAPGLMVQGDATRLMELLVNLVENGVRHTPAGGSVSVVVEPAGAFALVTVRDTGTGIAVEHLPHLFERFYRIDGSRAGRAGLGLGLSIGKAIVEAHGGRIDVNSRPGYGASFRVWLPCGGHPPHIPTRGGPDRASSLLDRR